MRAPLICPRCGHKIRTLLMYGGVIGQTGTCKNCGKKYRYSYAQGDTAPTVISVD